ncbi:hypothetical protein [Mycobacterium sp. EPa45]|uniref:hypothetical protein n=1 Tax=Mycobacterium sp. EPa45 TaxID=1545728 RepID=UPI0006427852|nr:hypothetical protein [Mycobacterium sp. EPa45]AKK29671.1 hypothetical protein AB431_26685 [Mycobacterium sp. EPa45]
MTALIAFLLLALLAVGVSRLRLRAGQFRVSAPMVGPLFVEGGDADARRISHDLDAVRTRFEQHPSWPSSGVLGERR